MKGNELIEKILNNEIKGGTLIKLKSNYPGLEWEKTLCFNGNWFSEGEYYPGIPRYDDIILYLCSNYYTFEIIEEDKKIGKLDLDWAKVFNFKEQAQQDCVKMVFNKINEITDRINNAN